MFLISAALLFIMMWANSCTGDRLQQDDDLNDEYRLENSPMVNGQVNPPERIRSVQLYKNDQKASIPAINLNSEEYVTLRFDELGSSGRMFRVRVRHRNADWSDSHLIPGFYLGGYREDLISGGQVSNVQRPAYTHYSYRFPNEEMYLELSGNYLMEVLDYETSRVIFSVPFFVYEDHGRIGLDFEELYGMDARYRVHHQPFARYGYPPFVLSPQMDLELYFVQNRFWGRARQTDISDISESGVYRAYLSRPRAYPGVYEFRPLNLSRYDDPGPEVVDIRSETTPPRVRLYRDVVNLDVNPSRRSPALHGQPRDDLDARYVDVRFELQIPRREATDLPVYIYGPFNNWNISESNRMAYREETDSYTGRAIVKEGAYDYKYALVDNGRVDDLRLDASYATTRQEYSAMVYFWDSGRQAHRLLQFESQRTR